MEKLGQLNNKYDLEERLITFSVQIIDLVKGISTNQAGKALSNQLVRSGTSPSLNYGEAQAGESRRDFIHKMGICLKELRETHVCLRIIDRAKLHKSQEKLEKAKKECNELISIFVKSLETAKRNLPKSQRR